jgi:hypothetical protein
LLDVGIAWNILRFKSLSHKMPSWFTKVALLTVILALPSSAAVIELRPVADTTLHAINAGNNMGAHTHLAIGTTAKDTPARGLFRFDLGAIPTNAAVSAVTLTFNLPALNRPDSGGTIYAVHRMLTAWGEGTKTGNLGSAGTAGEATWQHSAIPTTWTAPGGAAGTDYAAAASATQSIGPAPGVYTINSTAALVTDVQNWVWQTEQNLGWLLKAEDETVLQTARQFSSRETANGALLRVEYSVGPAPELQITSIERVSTNVVIRWSGQGNVGVERAPELNAAWERVAASVDGAITNAITGARAFFRLRVD